MKTKLIFFSILVNGLDELCTVIKRTDESLLVRFNLNLVELLNGRQLSVFCPSEQQQQRQNASETPPSYGISVYTIEHGRRTLINYEMPPRSPAHLVTKEELPPTYEDALKLHRLNTTENPPTSTTVTTVASRRLSV